MKTNHDIPALTTDDQGKLLGGYAAPDTNKTASSVSIKNRNCHGSAFQSSYTYDNYNCYETCKCR